jgi:hypothetical protein
MDYLSKFDRLKIIEDIKAEENRARKRKSFKEFECYTDNLKKYVDEAIVKQFSAKTKSMMPVVASINLVKRIVDQESSVYMEPPNRTFVGSIDEQTEQQLEALYEEISFDTKALKAERIFNLQKQAHVYFRLVDGKFLVQPIYAHNLDVVESETNPEIADAYIISNFDKTEDVDSDQVNQIIADKDDYKRSLERYTLWTKDYNFVFNGNGDIVGDQNDIENPLGIVPIIDLALTKDFTYYVQDGSNLVNFCIDYNVSLSDLMFISRLQGFAQGAVSGDKEVLDKMTTVEMGVAHLIKLANSPDGNPTKLEFIQRGSDINGSIRSIEVLLSTYLTSKGIDPKVVTGSGESVKYSSGIDRLLAMIEKFEASRANFDLFLSYERKALDILASYLRVYNGRPQILDSKYFMTLPEDLSVSVKWRKPEMIQGEKEKVDLYKAKIDANLMSPVEAIMEDRKLSREEAEFVYRQIQQDTLGLFDGQV